MNYRCLTKKRTEYGKAIRKGYESHTVSARRCEIQHYDIRGGQFIDLYNQQVYKDIAGTITTRVDQCSRYWITVIEDEEDSVPTHK